jgi:hypothetical protein
MNLLLAIRSVPALKVVKVHPAQNTTTVLHIRLGVEASDVKAMPHLNRPIWPWPAYACIRISIGSRRH